MPTGTIQFYSNGVPIGSGTISGGQISIVAPLAEGSYQLEAAYLGDINYIVATSNIIFEPGAQAASPAAVSQR